MCGSSREVAQLRIMFVYKGDISSIGLSLLTVLIWSWVLTVDAILASPMLRFKSANINAEENRSERPLVSSRRVITPKVF